MAKDYIREVDEPGKATGTVCKGASIDHSKEGLKSINPTPLHQETRTMTTVSYCREYPGVVSSTDDMYGAPKTYCNVIAVAPVSTIPIIVTVK